MTYGRTIVSGDVGLTWETSLFVVDLERCAATYERFLIDGGLYSIVHRDIIDMVYGVRSMLPSEKSNGASATMASIIWKE